MDIALSGRISCETFEGGVHENKTTQYTSCILSNGLFIAVAFDLKYHAKYTTSNRSSSSENSTTHASWLPLPFFSSPAAGGHQCHPINRGKMDNKSLVNQTINDIPSSYTHLHTTFAAYPAKTSPCWLVCRLQQAEHSKSLRQAPRSDLQQTHFQPNNSHSLQ